MTSSRCGRATRGSRVHCPRASSSYKWNICCRDRRTPQSYPTERMHRSWPNWNATEWRVPCSWYTSPTRWACRLATPRQDCASLSPGPSAWHRSWPGDHAVCDALAFECDRWARDLELLARALCHIRLCGHPVKNKQALVTNRLSIGLRIDASHYFDDSLRPN